MVDGDIPWILWQSPVTFDPKLTGPVIPFKEYGEVLSPGVFSIVILEFFFFKNRVFEFLYKIFIGSFTEYLRVVFSIV